MSSVLGRQFWSKVCRERREREEEGDGRSRRLRMRGKERGWWSYRHILIHEEGGELVEQKSMTGLT